LNFHFNNFFVNSSFLIYDFKKFVIQKIGFLFTNDQITTRYSQ